MSSQQEAAGGFLDKIVLLLTAHRLLLTQKKGEAADPRNRLPPSQLVSPLRKGGPSEAREYIPHAPWLQAILAAMSSVSLEFKL